MIHKLLLLTDANRIVLLLLLLIRLLLLYRESAAIATWAHVDTRMGDTTDTRLNHRSALIGHCGRCR